MSGRFRELGIREFMGENCRAAKLGGLLEAAKRDTFTE